MARTRVKPCCRARYFTDLIHVFIQQPCLTVLLVGCLIDEGTSVLGGLRQWLGG